MARLHDCPRIVLATTNANKLRELRSLLAELNVPLIGLDDIGREVPPAPEDGNTLAENARAKAVHYAELLNEWVLSDDTGLEVDALAGAPGVRSARYAGPAATMAENRQKLLRQLGGTPPTLRTARFVCRMAVAAPDGLIMLEAEGHCAGGIRLTPAGSRGFGYDVLFEVAELGRTLAELDEFETARVGHRGQAARVLITAWRAAI